MGHKDKKKSRLTVSEKFTIATALVTMITELIKLLTALIDQ